MGSAQAWTQGRRNENLHAVISPSLSHMCPPPTASPLSNVPRPSLSPVSPPSRPPAHPLLVFLPPWLLPPAIRSPSCPAAHPPPRLPPPLPRRPPLSHPHPPPPPRARSSSTTSNGAPAVGPALPVLGAAVLGALVTAAL
ncbi:hypothetical protein CERSUDRAFT_91810 [Gelatoporia subvermispora B]|uniref:Uncharacterized protein n=1 Tax=Ceriporiopsis subvermispora (strain B) TaxID=914234 RepID=M2PW69_CERS8|nr:hypothetical protein CERSUDRAFT_91810 [Gelatoporia subvermispora B]